jgi:hypothetical protein
VPFYSLLNAGRCLAQISRRRLAAKCRSPRLDLLCAPKNAPDLPFLVPAFLQRTNTRCHALASLRPSQSRLAGFKQKQHAAKKAFVLQAALGLQGAGRKK